MSKLCVDRNKGLISDVNTDQKVVLWKECLALVAYTKKRKHQGEENNKSQFTL